MPEITVPAQQVLPILRDSILVDGFHLVIDLEKSHGNVMVDALDGREYLDCYSYFASLPIGHNHPGMDDAAFQRTLLRSALVKPANSDVYSREYAAFVEVFRRVAVPDEFRYLFFVSGGALAVENAMKAAFDWKVRRNLAAGIEGGGNKILHFVEAFHGRSGYTLSTTNTEPRKTRYFPTFDWPRISNPKVRFPVDEAATATAEERSLHEIETAFAADPYGIAAIIIEPIQGEGGDNHFRPEFLHQLRRIADERGSLLIFDEVQTGMGLTGTMWAFQQMGVVPDIVSFGKKSQVCGIMSTTRIDEVPENVFHVSSRINSTWGGNLVDMVRAARYLQIIEQEQLVRNAADVGAHFLAGLQRLQDEESLIDNARGRGLMLAFDVPDTDTRDRLRSECWEVGLATLACGPRSIRFRPALTFTTADADRALVLLEEAIGRLD